jgi:Myb DNA-binding like
MATRRRIKPVLNLANIRKPVKEEKPIENVPAIKIDNDENEKLFKLPPQDSDTLHFSKEKEFSHIEAGCQSPTKLKYAKIRPNMPSMAATPIPSEDHEIRPMLASGLNRIRTESVSSTKSSVFNFHNRDRKESNRIRQISRCEEKEKVVESKREIKSRYANPDKMRLTMFDMIYYNPTGNPMQKKPAMRPIADSNNKDLSKVPANSTLSPTKADVKVELRKPKVEEMSTVPQLKLGPNGEIVLDEKSLTIENLKEKEAREQIANSKIQYDDEYSNNYGYYKRQKRTKDWPADETVKFYKCLHTVGTDFSLM